MTWAPPSSFNSSAHVTKAAASFCHRPKVMEIEEIFGDPIIAKVILDHLLHHSTTINVRGESYRLKDRRRAGLLPRSQQETALAAAPGVSSASATPIPAA